MKCFWLWLKTCNLQMSATQRSEYICCTYVGCWIRCKSPKQATLHKEKEIQKKLWIWFLSLWWKTPLKYKCQNAINSHSSIFLDLYMPSANDSLKVFIKFWQHTLEKSSLLVCIVGSMAPFCWAAMIIVLPNKIKKTYSIYISSYISCINH